MKFRIESTLGWMMLGGLGGELTGAYRPGLFPPPPVLQGRRGGMSGSRASGKILDLHAAQQRLVEQYPPPRRRPDEQTAAPVVAIDEMANVDAALELFGDELARMTREWGVSAEEITDIIDRTLRDQTTAAADAEADAAPSRGRAMKARPCAMGMTIVEAMERQFELADWPALVAHLRERYYFWGPSEANITVEPYAHDERIGWHTHLVCIEGKAALYTDGMPEGIPDHARKPGKGEPI